MGVLLVSEEINVSSPTLTEIEEKHCTCVFPYPYAYLNCVNIIVLMLALMLPCDQIF